MKQFETLVLPGGNRIMTRRPQEKILDGWSVATPQDLFSANLGYIFPWGNSLGMSERNILWKNHMIGVGGTVHEKWFRTTTGRFGGAKNILQQGKGLLRFNMLTSGGGILEDPLEENEGYALVMESDEVTQKAFHEISLYAAEHIGADGGRIIMSPACEGKIYIGFTGRCLMCPNMKFISLPQLQSQFPEYTIELLPEWKTIL